LAWDNWPSLKFLLVEGQINTIITVFVFLKLSLKKIEFGLSSNF